MSPGENDGPGINYCTAGAPHWSDRTITVDKVVGDRVEIIVRPNHTPEQIWGAILEAVRQTQPYLGNANLDNWHSRPVILIVAKPIAAPEVAVAIEALRQQYEFDVDMAGAELWLPEPAGGSMAGAYVLLLVAPENYRITPATRLVNPF
ncbi:MAG: hypothetical protein V1826_03120 [bacterium]